MISVAAITSGKNLPSTRFRIRQHIDPLQRYGVGVMEYCPRIDKYAPIPFLDGRVNHRYILPVHAAWMGVKLMTRIPGILASRSHQVTWLSRELLPGYPSLEKLLKKPLAFDVDDAIWLTTPFGKSAIQRIARFSDLILAGNDHIANWFAPISNRVHVIPTAVDTHRFKPHREMDMDNEVFTIGWTGSSATLPFLEAIESPLARFLREFKHTRITIMADRKVCFKNIPPEKINCRRWSPHAESNFLNTMDVGLMPMPDTAWTRGKCAYKMLLYMATGVPVIVSPVGMNRDVLAMGDVGLSARTDDEWYEALVYIYRHRTSAATMGKTGRGVILNHFDRYLVTQRIADLFHHLI